MPVLEAMHFGKPVFVRGGTAAQEICPPNCVFAADAELGAWVQVMMPRIGQSAGRSPAEAAYVKHADGVLQRAGDGIWQSILIGVGAARAAAPVR